MRLPRQTTLELRCCDLDTIGWVNMGELPLLRNGEWTTCQDPVPDGSTGIEEELLNKAGYSKATEFFPGGDACAITLTVWGDGVDPSYPGRRAANGAPKYLVDVEFPYGGEFVAVATFVDLMNLLAKWTPVVTAGLACDDSARRRTKNS